MPIPKTTECIPHKRETYDFWSRADGDDGDCESIISEIGLVIILQALTG